MIKLETERLMLRDHELADLDAYLAMESDAEYRWPQLVHPRTELERSFHLAWLPPKRMGLMATVFKPDTAYIGRCGLYPLHSENGTVVANEARIGFYLARPYWGRGLATEAGRALVAHGFDQLGLARIEAGIDAENKASLRVIEKLGFVWVRSGEGGGRGWHLFELLAEPSNRDGRPTSP